MIHRSGKFVVEKLFIVGNNYQRYYLYHYILDHFDELSLNKYGCRVVQIAIETTIPLQLFCLMQKINQDNIVQLTTDMNANYVIQLIFRKSANLPGCYSLQVILCVNTEYTIIDAIILIKSNDF